MKKFYSILASLGLSLMTLVGISFVSAPAANAGDSPNIQICHATSSEKNPYNPVTISKTAIVTGKGDQGHGSQHDGDIIPPFTYGDPLKTYPGKNWTPENQAIYNNSCNIPLKVATPLAPTYTPGTCINPNGTVNLSDQPVGVTLNSGPILDGNIWKVSYVPTEGYKFANETSGIFAFTVVGPDSSDPNWDVEAGACKLPNMGAGISSEALMIGGGLIGAGMLFLAVSLFTRRRQTA